VKKANQAKGKRRKRRAGGGPKPISLAPLTPEQILAAMIQTKPPKR